MFQILISNNKKKNQTQEGEDREVQHEKESIRERGNGMKSQLAVLWENFIRAGILTHFCGKPV